jgi:hypothetical protein
MSVRIPQSARRTDSRLSRVRGRVFVFGIVIVLGLVVHALLFFLISVPIGEGPREVREDAWIGWDGEHSPELSPMRTEQALLLDAEPLFVPTPWNSASALDEIARLRDETELFPPFPPRLGTSAALWTPPSPPRAAELLDERLASAVTSSPFRLLGRGEERAPTPATPTSPALLEIFALASGEAVGSPLPFQAQGEPPPATLWNPLEFLVVVDTATGGGLPLRLNSSGSPAWDQAVSTALRQHPLLGTLPHGYFRVVIGP